MVSPYHKLGAFPFPFSCLFTGQPPPQLSLLKGPQKVSSPWDKAGLVHGDHGEAHLLMEEFCSRQNHLRSTGHLGVECFPSLEVCKQGLDAGPVVLHRMRGGSGISGSPPTSGMGRVDLIFCESTTPPPS